jgi:hypothetical protein
MDNSLPFDVFDVISFQNVLEKLDNMTIANLCRQEQTTLSPYIFSSHHEGIFHLSLVLLFVFQFILQLVLIEHVSMIILFIKCIPFNNVTFNGKFVILLNVTFQLYKTKKIPNASQQVAHPIMIDFPFKTNSNHQAKM